MFDIAGAVGAINIAIDEVKAVANGDVDLGKQHASAAQTTFAGARISASAFSEVPLAAEIAAQQGAVHDVFTETIAGVVSDLQEVRETLIACAENHAVTDEGTEATLVALNKRMRGHTWRSTTAYDQSRRSEGAALPPESGKGQGAPRAGSTGSSSGSGAPSGGRTTG